MSDPKSSTEVLVIGGGMAGLAGALALRENGAEVTLVERAPEFGEVGAGLQMAPNASRVLKRWGLLEKALEIGVQPRHLVFRDAVTGEELTRQTLGGEFEERYGAPYVVIHRSDLHRVLLEGCEAAGVKLVNDVMVESVETVNGRAVAHTAAGVDYEADVVIGADGLKSTLRPLVANDEPVPSAYVAYRGTVPITEKTPKADLEDVIVYLGPDCHLVQYPLRKGELLNTVAGTMREREYIRRQVSALAAEGKLSAYVLGGLPPGFMLYLLLANRPYVMVLFTRPLGLLMLAGGAVILTLGMFWMSRIIKVEV